MSTSAQCYLICMSTDPKTSTYELCVCQRTNQGPFELLLTPIKCRSRANKNNHHQLHSLAINLCHIDYHMQQKLHLMCHDGQCITWSSLLKKSTNLFYNGHSLSFTPPPQTNFTASSEIYKLLAHILCPRCVQIVTTAQQSDVRNNCLHKYPAYQVIFKILNH